MTEIVKACLVAVLVVAGMAGLYFKIEYSGWVLGVALYVLVHISDRIETQDDDAPKK